LKLCNSVEYTGHKCELFSYCYMCFLFESIHELNISVDVIVENQISNCWPRTSHAAPMALDISYVNTCGLLNYISFLMKYSINLQQQRQENFVFEVG